MKAEDLRQLVSRRLGVQVRDKDTAKFQETLAARCRELRLPGLDSYAEFLQRRESESEWEHLATLLTTGETFFFRDKGQIELLRTCILPELIELRRAERKLRIWSAGCSSGEEPYSIAILLRELLAGQSNWQTFILATDIDAVALNKARAGLYTAWSFRKVEPELQRKYFDQRGQDWEIQQQLRDMVMFQTVNLITDEIPNAMVREMDLIVCRNVFIYFDREHVASIVKKFSATLRNGAYMLTGHGELQGQKLDPLERRVFSTSVAYRQNDSLSVDAPAAKPLVQVSRSATRHKPPSSDAQTRAFGSSNDGLAKHETPPEKTPADDLLDECQQLLLQGQHTSALQKAEQIVKDNSQDLRAHCLLAQTHADLSNHEKAMASCKRAMEIDPFATSPLYLLAHIAESEGRYQDAKSSLKKVIYLDPSHIAAQLDMAALLEREGDLDQARKTRLAVIEILKSARDDERIEFHGHLTAGQLAKQIKQAMSNGQRA